MASTVSAVSSMVSASMSGSADLQDRPKVRPLPTIMG